MLDTEFIKERLAAVARQHNVEVLYACESGSRAWGLGSKDSDYDVRFVYRQPRETYLSLGKFQDMIGPIMENDGELDLVGWDVRKFLSHLGRSNPGVVDWLSSPIVYHRNGHFLKDFRELSCQYFDVHRAANHYLGIARGARLAGCAEDGSWNLKKFCYWMRPILAADYAVKKGNPPPITIDELLVQIEEPTVVMAIQELIARKATVAEDYRTQISPEMEGYLEAMAAEVGDKLVTIRTERNDFLAINRYFRVVSGWE